MKTNWTLILSAAAILLTVLNMIISMDRVSEEGAAVIEARLSAVEFQVKANSEDNAERKKKLSNRYIFMRDTAQIIEYLCGRDEQCQNRFEPIEVPE